MRIKIKYSGQEEPITVQTLDGDGNLWECNHAGAEIEEVDFGYADPNICDWVDDWRDALVCDKCNEVME